jgi:hypothetical protein
MAYKSMKLAQKLSQASVQLKNKEAGGQMPSLRRGNRLKGGFVATEVAISATRV